MMMGKVRLLFYRWISEFITQLSRLKRESSIHQENSKSVVIELWSATPPYLQILVEGRIGWFDSCRTFHQFLWLYNCTLNTICQINQYDIGNFYQDLQVGDESLITLSRSPHCGNSSFRAEIYGFSSNFHKFHENFTVCMILGLLYKAFQVWNS